MLKFSFAATAAVLLGASAAAAQEAAIPVNAEPVVAVPVPSASATMLPANTEITLSLNEELSSRRHHEGDTFHLSVVGNVMFGDYVVIPAGTRAVGEVTWMTGRGMFGKSGKMNIAIRYIALNGRHIPVEGTFRQEGEGNTVATLAGVAVIPIAGLFITGRSAVVPAGRHLTVHLRDNLPVALPAVANAAPRPVQATTAMAASETPEIAEHSAAAPQ
jgi:hypothetical protein